VAKQIDFSLTYFFTGQKFIVRKGTVKTLAGLDGKRIGTAEGSTSERNAAKVLPKATVLSFDDYPQAFLALQQGKVFAVTTDESILAPFVSTNRFQPISSTCSYWSLLNPYALIMEIIHLCCWHKITYWLFL
jgi:ABC-type amino acid transport substrate-binding protein